MADFSQFDSRNYPTLSVREGYDEWAATYEHTVLDLMDLRLLARLKRVDWKHVNLPVSYAMVWQPQGCVGESDAAPC